MDTLQRIKKSVNIDQRNLASGTVISTSNSTARVRLYDGTEKTAYSGDLTLSDGDLVQVTIDGNLCSVQGAATLQRRAATKTVILT